MLSCGLGGVVSSLREVLGSIASTMSLNLGLLSAELSRGHRRELARINS